MQFFSTPSIRLSLAVALLTTPLLACGDDDDSGHDHDHEVDDVDAGSPDPTPVAGNGGGETGGSVKIRFVPKVGSKKFACGDSYTGLGTPAREAEPVDFRFYVHDVRLVTADGKETEVELVQDKTWQYQNVALIDFEDGEGACDQGDKPTHDTIEGDVEPGVYTAVKFKLGIPQKLNHADLSSQPSPLNKSSLFWGWNYGHIFFAATTRTASLVDEDAGVGDDADAGVMPLNDHFTHVGSTGCDGDPAGGVAVKACSHPNRPEYTLTGFDAGKNAIVVDLAAVKKDSDIAATAGCHSFDAETCSWPFDHLGINFATGSLTPTSQTVFKVE